MGNDIDNDWDSAERGEKEKRVLLKGASNWVRWLAATQALMEKKKVWKFVIADLTKQKEGETPEEFKKRVDEDYLDKATSALGELKLSVHESYREKIAEKTTAFDAMEELKKNYAKKSITTVASIQREFFNVMMSGHGMLAMDKHFNELEAIRKELKGTKGEVTEDTMSNRAMESLGEDWEDICEKMRDDLTDSTMWTDVRANLLDKARTRKHTHELGKGGKKSNKSSGVAFEAGRSIQGNCYNCGEEGHSWRYCTKPDRNQKPESSKPKGGRSHAHHAKGGKGDKQKKGESSKGKPKYAMSAVGSSSARMDHRGISLTPEDEFDFLGERAMSTPRNASVAIDPARKVILTPVISHGYDEEEVLYYLDDDEIDASDEAVVQCEEPAQKLSVKNDSVAISPARKVILTPVISHGYDEEEILYYLDDDDLMNQDEDVTELPPVPTAVYKEFYPYRDLILRREMNDCRPEAEIDDEEEIKQLLDEMEQRAEYFPLLCRAFMAEHSKDHPVALAMMRRLTNDGRWIIDSGASDHLCNQKELFTTLDEKAGSVEITCANNQVVLSSGIGTIELKTTVGKISNNCVLEDVLYCENIGKNLLSLGKLDKHGMEITVKGGRLRIKKDGVTVAIGKRDHDGLYKLVTGENSYANFLEITRDNDVNRWHKIFTHLNERDLRLTIPGLTGTFQHCDACFRGKATKQPWKTETRPRPKEPLDEIHSDLMGPFSEGDSGEKYVATYIDGFTDMTHIALLNSKDEQLQHMYDYIAMAETHFGRKVKSIYCDGGGEYVSNEFKSWCKERGTRIIKTNADTPEQNAIAERRNRTLLGNAKSTLIDSGLGKSYWTDAMLVSAHARNRSLGTNSKDKTPYERWFGKKPDPGYMHQLGEVCYLYTEKKKRGGKMGDNSVRCIFLGYTDNGLKIQEVASGRVRFSRHVRFPRKPKVLGLEKPESDSGSDSSSESDVRERVTFAKDEPAAEADSEDDDDDDAEAGGDVERKVIQTSDELPIEQQEGTDEDEREAPSTPRNKKQPEYYPKKPSKGCKPKDNATFQPDSDDQDDEDKDDFTPVKQYRTRSMARAEASKSVSETGNTDKGSTESRANNPGTPAAANSIVRRAIAFMTAAKGIIIPKSYEEAITGPQAEEWKEAIAAELASLIDRKTWMVAEVRPNQHRVGTKWVFDLKLDESGKFIIRYKARLVARGFTQKKGFDYQEVFAPVVRHTTIRLFMAIRTLRRMKVLQLDISTAFLNGDIDYDVFITTPKGLEHSLSPNQALKLVKGLYGTKQGARCWNIELTNTLMAHGYEQCVSDPCVFYRKGDASYIIVYVDDLMLFYTIDQTATELKAAILKKYKIGKESDGAYFLGIHSRFGPGVTTMSQETYVAEIVETFGGDRRTIASTPMTVGIDLMRDPKALPFECPYRELNGALLYAANVTRMDIAYAAGMLCRYLDKPEEKHWDAGSRLVDYLRGTKEIGLKFTAKKEITHAALKLSDLGLEAFADADWAADKENRASISGYVVKACGGPISWRSRKQKSIACSTMEAEYVSIAEACKEIVWIRHC